MRRSIQFLQEELEPLANVYNHFTQKNEERTPPIRTFETVHYTLGDVSDISDLSVSIDFEFIATRTCEVTRGVQLSRIQFFNTQMEEITYNWIDLHQGAHDPNEGPDKLLDPNLNTRWYDKLVKQCRQSSKISARMSDIPSYYVFTTALDHLERDPLQWRVSFANRSWVQTHGMPEKRGAPSDPLALSSEEYNRIRLNEDVNATFSKCTCLDRSSYRASSCEFGRTEPFDDTHSSLNLVDVSCAIDLNLCDCSRRAYDSSIVDIADPGQIITGCGNYGGSESICIVDSRCPFGTNTSDSDISYMTKCEGCAADGSFPATKVGRTSTGESDCPDDFYQWRQCLPQGWDDIAPCVSITFSPGVLEFPGYYPYDVVKHLNFTIHGNLTSHLPVYINYIEGSAKRGSDWRSLYRSPVIFIPPGEDTDYNFSTEHPLFAINGAASFAEMRNFTIELVLPPARVVDSIEVKILPPPACGAWGHMATATRDMYKCESGLITTDIYRQRACLDVDTGESLFPQDCADFVPSMGTQCTSPQRETNATLATICYKYDCCIFRENCETTEAVVEFCHCPKDFSGPMCEVQIPMQCEIEIPSAPTCDEPLRIGGYDPDLNGDGPCHIVSPIGLLNTSFQLNCSLDLSQKESNIPDGYNFHARDAFHYWAENGDFKLTYAQDFFVQKKLFNFNKPSDNRHTVILRPNQPHHFTGEALFHYAISIPELDQDFQTAGRIYAEYRECKDCSLDWEVSGDVPFAHKERVSSCTCPSSVDVHRRFYDLEGYRLTTRRARRSKTALWISLPLTLMFILILAYFVWKRRNRSFFSI